MEDSKVDALSDEAIHRTIKLLIDNLCNIKDESGQFLQHLPSGQSIDTKSWDTDSWDWTHGVGLYGLWLYFSLSHDPPTLERLRSWFAARFAADTTVPKNINTMAPFLPLAHLYQATGDKSYLPHLHSWSNWAMSDLTRTPFSGMQHDTHEGANPGQLWEDTLMMTVLPLAKIGILLHQPSYVAEAKHQFLLHIQYLFDAATGAFFHGWTFQGKHNFARARWARGNSWLTIAIPEFIEMCEWEVGDPVSRHLMDTLEAQVEFLRSCQDIETGMWHTLLDQDDEESYLEASATAGFAYGILKALRLGLLREEKAQEYHEVAERAVRAVIANVDGSGELQKVSFGTAMGSDLDFYRRIPITSMPYGQAMAIMALSEYLQRRR